MLIKVHQPIYLIHHSFLVVQMDVMQEIVIQLNH